VSEARDGVQALDQVDRVGPDIIVLDLNMPGLDGYGVLSHLRSRPATADIPVIVLTAKSDEDNEVRVFELGADDFLTKPFRARVRHSAEHDRAEWLEAPAAAARFSWPRERRALDDVLSILGSGDAGLLEDVLRVC